ncbi:MAG: ABC transporter permease [Chloroflexi bacterium]|nr:ABC transporter permease [Chloroflexota bacterium]
MNANGQSTKIVQYVGVLFVALTLNFLLPRLMPGNPLELLAGAEVGMMSPAERQQVIEAVGLDRPLHLQFVKYIGDVLTGNFGYSYRQNRPIIDMIAERLPWTLFLATSSLILSAIIGIVLGALAALRRGRLFDILMYNSMIVIDSLPSFWIGMLGIAIFAVRLGLLPSQGAVTPASGYQGIEYFRDVLEHAILPIATLSIVSTPRIFLMMRYTMIGVIGEDFIRTARSKGLTERAILSRHIIPNALIPVVTVLALRFGFAFGGTVVIETVFSYPGLGRLIFEAVRGRDYPVMQAGFLLITIAVLASNLFADWLYPKLDPRVRAS